MADVIARIYSCKYPRAVYRLGGYRAACDSLANVFLSFMMSTGEKNDDHN